MNTISAPTSAMMINPVLVFMAGSRRGVLAPHITAIAG